MGASAAYNVFAGLAEMIGGLLLTFRRTTLLGALICAGVMAQVVMLNFSYDVPVKLYSSHLLLTAIVLALPDAKRLADFFLFNRPVPPATIRRLFKNRFAHAAAVFARTALVLLFAGYMLANSWKAYSSEVSARADPSIRGIWDVREFTLDGQHRPPLFTDSQRWRRVILDRADVFAIQLMNEQRVRYYLPPGEQRPDMFVLSRREDETWRSLLTFQKTDPTHLSIRGSFDDHVLSATLEKTQRDFELVKRGFHWINERPYSR